MKLKIIGISRILLGLVFFLFGLNGFFDFLPHTPPPAEAEAFTAAYFFPFVKVIETVCGALLLFNRFVPLAIAVITPVVINILLFHLFLDPQGLVIAIPLVAFNSLLMLGYRDAFRPMLKVKVKPM
ncbi:hypothetical protein QQ008_23090 [Fulvivirgaceae bacterium BMA10]|uniref:DoxX family membrane protein n=1 Tax=Splendidivirga corallicola TaxID=3051826 RepID=A0ABT8KU44_9BACT|nr:hypothetical protein [Fulvivirgaceae bacterium BMA10]